MVKSDDVNLLIFKQLGWWYSPSAETSAGIKRYWMVSSSSGFMMRVQVQKQNYRC